MLNPDLNVLQTSFKLRLVQDWFKLHMSLGMKNCVI
jgi:hypothetical protein